MNTAIITSINPYANLAYQKQCFDKWVALGYLIKTYNHKVEKDILLKNGFNEHEIVELVEGETALNLFGKPIPRILPLLNRAQQLPVDYVMLVNSDIYPAMKKNISEYLASLAPHIALTRQECLGILDINRENNFPYRGGLDIFFFTAKYLNTFVEQLLQKTLSERMTFGVPGWDFFLAHELRQHSGIIMDGAVFFHKSHATTYANSEEMQFYVEEMFKSGLYQSNQFLELTAEFAEYINQSCIKNSSFSTVLRKIYLLYSNQEPAEIKHQKMLKITKVEKKLTQLFVSNGLQIENKAKIRNFIDSQMENLNWDNLLIYQQIFFKNQSFFDGFLLLDIIQLIIKNKKNKKKLSTSYPPNSLHKKALKQIIDNKLTSEQRLEYIMRLFATELCLESIYNPSLFRYIILSTKTSYSLGLCSVIHNLCQKRLPHYV
jgi:hypothetical protein